MAIRRELLILAIFWSWSTNSTAAVLYHGQCVLKDDPATAWPGVVNLCIGGSAGSWVTQKSVVSNSMQPPVLHRADGRFSLFVTPWISIHTEGHSSILIDRQTNLTVSRENVNDSVNFQIGNNALSRHRVSFGKGRAPFRIDHNQRRNLDYIWDLDQFLAPVVDYGMYTYDNQLDWTIQTTYGRLTDSNLRPEQRLFGSARAMHDVAALEGTRIVIGGYGDGLIRRALALGLLNINGKKDETAVEITRTFTFNPYAPAEFHQLIRLSYISHVQDNLRYKFQYDDFFRYLRLGGLSLVYLPFTPAEFEFTFGYAKREDSKKLSHWYALVHAGVHL